jgi:hypothetical protein
MDGNRSRRVALAILAVVAVGLVATAASPLFAQGPGSESPRDESTPGNSSTDQFSIFESIPIEYVGYAVAAVVAVAIAAQFVTDPWGTLKKALAGVAITAVLVGIVYVAFEYLFDPEPPEMNISDPRPEFSNGTPPNGSAGFGDGASDSPLLPTDGLAVIVLVAAVLGGVTLLAWRVGAIQTALGFEDDGAEESTADLGALGEVAGRAADDVEGAATATAADNAIYRAWSEMVALLDAPDPQSGTPREFAAAAIDAGMNPEEVDVLTRTFEEVRYGDAALSEERRERATEALRRIEDTYGQDDGPSIQGREDSDRNTRDGTGTGDPR